MATNHMKRTVQAGRQEGIPLPPIRRGGHLPLSFAQQRLWFIETLEPGNVAYNLPFGLWFTGHMDIKALEYSLNQVVCRHEALRTRFSVCNGEPVQTIQNSAPVSVKVVDLRHTPQADREQKIELLLHDEAERPFNLEEGPLLRMQLILAGEAYVLLGNMHHIISDGWSIGIMLREISQCYVDALQGVVTAQPALPIQYADFAVWQHEWLRSGMFDRQLEYWKKQLAAVPVLDFPTDHVRPAVRSHKGGRAVFRFPDTLRAQVRALCRKEKTTLFMALMAVFQVLLSKYTGESDVPVGTAIANRSRKEVRG